MDSVIKLEEKFDKEVTRILCCNTQVGYALGSNLSFTNCKGSFIINDSLDKVEWINFSGFYSDLVETITVLKKFLAENKSDLKLLVKSYQEKRKNK